MLPLSLQQAPHGKEYLLNPHHPMTREIITMLSKMENGHAVLSGHRRTLKGDFTKVQYIFFGEFFLFFIVEGLGWFRMLTRDNLLPFNF